METEIQNQLSTPKVIGGSGWFTKAVTLILAFSMRKKVLIASCYIGVCRVVVE